MLRSRGKAWIDTRLREANAQGVLAFGGYRIERRAPERTAWMGHERESFEKEARAIQARHDAQTRETIALLQRNHEPPVVGRVSVYSRLTRLSQCIDQGSKSLHRMPPEPLTAYRDLIFAASSEPILF